MHLYFKSCTILRYFQAQIRKIQLVLPIHSDSDYYKILEDKSPDNQILEYC